MRRIVMRWALLSFLLGGCQNPDLPRVASAHWPAPSAVRWTLDQPVPSELNALSIEFPPDLRADGAFDAVRRVRREGISTHEWVVFHEGRELAVPVSVPEMCPPRPSYAPVCASGRLNLSANDAALEFVLATPKRCTAQLFSSDPLSPQKSVLLQELGPSTFRRFELERVGLCDHVGLLAEPDVSVQRLVDAIEALERTEMEHLVFSVR
ncbi:MAG: hypothetical protein AAFY60_21265 [Myxococcota bacterium]